MADGPFGTAVSFYVWSFDFFNRGPGFSWGAELFAFGASDPFVCFCCFAFFDGDGLPQCVLDLEDGGWKDVVFARKHAVSKQCGADDPGDGDLFDLDLCCQFEPFDRSAGSWSCSRIFGRVFDGSDRLPADRIVNMASASKKMWMGSSNDRTTFGSNDGGKEDLFAGSGGSCGDHAGEFVEDQKQQGQRDPVFDVE